MYEMDTCKSKFCVDPPGVWRASFEPYFDKRSMRSFEWAGITSSSPSELSTLGGCSLSCGGSGNFFGNIGVSSVFSIDWNCDECLLVLSSVAFAIMKIALFSANLIAILEKAIQFTVFIFDFTVQSHFSLQQYLRFTFEFSDIIHCHAIPFVLPCPCLSMCCDLLFFSKMNVRKKKNRCILQPNIIKTNQIKLLCRFALLPLFSGALYHVWIFPISFAYPSIEIPRGIAYMRTSMTYFLALVAFFLRPVDIYQRI